MNHHNDNWITEKLKEHYKEATTIIDKDRIVGIFVQGSQNYGVDTVNSDLDTKLIITPTLDDLIYNRSPKSYTHVRDNDEHIDVKDIRLYMDCFRKQNVNFLEILFTPYNLVNEIYLLDWVKLYENREKIAHMNYYLSLKAFQGTAGNKYVALKHPYPSKLRVLDKYGYDPKQLHHLLRMEEFLTRYISGEDYEDILQVKDPEYLVAVKNGLYTLPEAELLAEATMFKIDTIVNNLTKDISKNQFDDKANEILKEVQSSIMKRSLKDELLKGDCDD